MQINDPILGQLVDTAMQLMGQSEMRSLCSFRNEGSDQQGGTVDDMRQIEAAVNPDVCLVQDGTFSCAADLYWNWGAYATESSACVKGRVVQNRGIVVESIDLLSCEN